mmetsp:Transcript_47525/g.152270  ORF Transcript_47525/g.152270 Transcript_47525/m.152270 type:complete len:204 (+) Transcript_47525:4816-5427(+)
MHPEAPGQSVLRWFERDVVGGGAGGSRGFTRSIRGLQPQRQAADIGLLGHFALRCQPGGRGPRPHPVGGGGKPRRRSHVEPSRWPHWGGVQRSRGDTALRAARASQDQCCAPLNSWDFGPRGPMACPGRILSLLLRPPPPRAAGRVDPTRLGKPRGGRPQHERLGCLRRRRELVLGVDGVPEVKPAAMACGPLSGGATAHRPL